MAAAVWVPLDDVDAENGTMSVMPGFHTRGQLPRLLDTSPGVSFRQSIQPAALEGGTAVEYKLQPGQVALHDVMLPHASRANQSNQRWRRVIVIRYLSAHCRLGTEVYEDFADGTTFPREYFCVGGSDRYGCRRSAFDRGPGFTGEAHVVSLGQPRPGSSSPPPEEPGIVQGPANHLSPLAAAAGVAAAGELTTAKL